MCCALCCVDVMELLVAEGMNFEGQGHVHHRGGQPPQPLLPMDPPRRGPPGHRPDTQLVSPPTLPLFQSAALASRCLGGACLTPVVLPTRYKGVSLASGKEVASSADELVYILGNVGTRGIGVFDTSAYSGRAPPPSTQQAPLTPRPPSY